MSVDRHRLRRCIEEQSASLARVAKVEMFSEDALRNGSLAFENRHNTTWRYSKIGGKTPVKALGSMKRTLRFPD